jgi:NADH-quinone oxidoreductase subunit J
MDTAMLALFSGLALLGAVMMMFLREPMRVAMALITTMASLGAVYGLLGVHFIAAFQVLIYVGAVMVFMVYVIMLLEVREQAGKARYSRVAIPGLFAFTMLLGVLGISVWHAPAAAAGAGSATVNDFGLTNFSTSFLRDYWLPFELTTVLLVAAIVAALAVIRVHRRING